MNGVVAVCQDCLEPQDLTVEQAITFSRRGGRCSSCAEDAEQYAREDHYVRPPIDPEAVLYVVGQRPL